MVPEREILTASRYLERERLILFPQSNIVLLRPSMSFMLMQTPDPRTLKEALPDFSRTTHIFLPINDCRNVEVAEGGSHWSLLVVSVIDGLAFHYDSLSPSNNTEARVVTDKMGQLLGCRLEFHNIESPQQQNSSDCGVFVCIQMKHLLFKKILRAEAEEKVAMGVAGSDIDASNGRKKMLRIIEDFRKEGEKRRSSVFARPSQRVDINHRLDTTAPRRGPMSGPRVRLASTEALLPSVACSSTLDPAFCDLHDGSQMSASSCDHPGGIRRSSAGMVFTAEKSGLTVRSPCRSCQILITSFPQCWFGRKYLMSVCNSIPFEYVLIGEIRWSSSQSSWLATATSWPLSS